MLVGARRSPGCRRSASCTCPDRFDRASELYGAIGTTIVTLGWFFILGRAIVLAMAINAVIYERFGSISQFVFSLPVLRALPRRFEWFRRFFQLAAVTRAPAATCANIAPMSYGMTPSTVAEYEQRAEEAERSPVPVVPQGGAGHRLGRLRHRPADGDQL